MKDDVKRWLKEGKAAAAELPASREHHRAFLRVTKLPIGGYAIVKFEMSDDVISELEERYETNDDFVDKRWETVADLGDIDEVVLGWGVDPDVVLPAWKVDFP